MTTKDENTKDIFEREEIGNDGFALDVDEGYTININHVPGILQCGTRTDDYNDEAGMPFTRHTFRFWLGSMGGNQISIVDIEYDDNKFKYENKARITIHIPNTSMGVFREQKATMLISDRVNKFLESLQSGELALAIGKKDGGTKLDLEIEIRFPMDPITKVNESDPSKVLNLVLPGKTFRFVKVDDRVVEHGYKAYKYSLVTSEEQ